MLVKELWLGSERAYRLQDQQAGLWRERMWQPRSRTAGCIALCVRHHSRTKEKRCASRCVSPAKAKTVS